MKSSVNRPQDVLYPSIEPYNTGRLKVSDIHELYYEQSGRKEGNPVIFFHGGPGHGTSPDNRRFFDAQTYRIILFDQRGAGKSTPAGELRENTTWHLIDDIERLREHLNIDKWVVFGGSWGSTLGLAYSQAHPSRVKALILRGIFAVRRRENMWFNQDGANMIFPDVWEDYFYHIPPGERGDMLSAYYRRFTSDDESVQVAAVRPWCNLEDYTSKLITKINSPSSIDKNNLHKARIECHYFVHGGFLKSDNQLLDDVDIIQNIPATIVHGRYDMVCPLETAWLFHKRWPSAEFHIIPTAGHSVTEPGVIPLLVQATDKYKHL